MKHQVILICFLTTTISLLAGCARINTQVTTYYKPSLQFAGKSFAFYKLAKLHQNANNQYDYFAGLISQKLTSIGMRQTSFKNANYAVVLIYWIGRGQEEEGYAPLYGQTGTQIVSSNTTGTYSGFGGYGNYESQTNYQSQPTYGVVGERAYEYMIYPCFIHFYIVRKNNLTGKPLYHATLFTTDINIPPSAIFTSMLKGYLGIFPGENGQTRTITTFINRQ